MCELVIVGEFMKKILLIIVVTLVIFLILSAVVIYNKIDYVYLNINGKNKQDVVSLLEEQNDYMFNIIENVNLDLCYRNLTKIEVIYSFPDGEDYTLYCNNDTVNFSLDNTNYKLLNYIRQNGKTTFRLK